jgi:hypothetical protein
MRTSRTRSRGVCVAAALLVCVSANEAQAQGARTAVRLGGLPRFDVSLGAGLVTGEELGAVDANLRANATTLQDYRLFSTSSRLQPAPAIDVRVAGTVSGPLAIEGQVQFGRPELRTTISNDVEGAADAVLVNQVTRVLLTGGVRLRLGASGAGTRLQPHVSAGGGLLRQALEGGGTTEQARVVYAGGGLRYALGAMPRGVARRGLRADVQWMAVDGGLGLDGAGSSLLAVTGGVFFAF